MPREGSFALASFGRVRKVQEFAFGASAGRKSFALKWILGTKLRFLHNFRLAQYKNQEERVVFLNSESVSDGIK
jgi:hypothetical protein